MAEEKIAERIDANLLDVPIDQLDKISKDRFSLMVNNIAKKTTGNLLSKNTILLRRHKVNYNY